MKKNNLKFSCIVPVYNVEKYLKKCIDSILNQTYTNYEIIIINDGSTDNSAEILKSYKQYKNIKIINQTNKGLSAARNTGLKYITGDYILFIDSDDYIDTLLLETLNNTITDEDLIRFQAKTVDEFYKTMLEYNETPFKNLNGIEAFNKIVNYKLIEPAWLYAYKKEYFLKNKFKFKENTYHEDFGLTPLIIIKSNNTTSIDFIGYNYLQRNNSIMHNNNYEKQKKQTLDVLEHYQYLNKETNKMKGDLSIFKSFIANTLILKSTNLKNKDYKNFKKILKQEKVYNQLLNNTTSRKLKNLLIKISPKLYYKMNRCSKWKYLL